MYLNEKFPVIKEGICYYLDTILVVRYRGNHCIGHSTEGRSSIYRSFLYYHPLPVCYPYPFRGYYLY